MKRSKPPPDNPTPPKKTNKLGNTSRAPIILTDEFPHFSKGTVLIELSPDPSYHYQLHKAVLERNSSRLAKLFSFQLSTSGTRYLLNLKYNTRLGMPILMYESLPGSLASHIEQLPTAERKVSGSLTQSASGDLDAQKDKPLRSMEKELQAPNSVTVKLESETKAQNTASAEAHDDNKDQVMKEEVYQDYLLAHHNLFSIFYCRPLLISSTDISKALEQCERLVAIAKFYNSLQVVAPHVGNLLAQFHHTLYSAIAENPPRWLKLAMALESPSIYQEALIHCAGSWPHWSWDVPCTSIHPKVLGIVAAKATDLEILCLRVNQELFVHSLSVAGKAVSLGCSSESWVVVQVFRDWVAHQIELNREANTARKGTFYRLMRKGGDAYLPSAELYSVLHGIKGNGMKFWDAVEEDLKALKNFASTAVAQLTKNNLILDVEAAGIEYLTCAIVNKEDYPWIT